MNAFIIYKSASFAPTNPYIQIVHVKSGKVWDASTSLLSAAPTYANTDIALALNAYYNGYPVVIPEDLPAGEYDVVVKDGASPANSDAATFGRRLEWDGANISNLRDI